MPRPKSRAELEQENERLKIELQHLQILHKTTSATSVINTFIKYASAVAIAFCVTLSIQALAGKTTAASILISFLTDMKVSEGVAYAFGVFFGGGGIAYGTVQKKLRRRVTRELATHNARLEKIVDPKRSSSNLTQAGDTNPEDEP
jgi:p-aminobenzoyl-glutamate transporter AbgT